MPIIIMKVSDKKKHPNADSLYVYTMNSPKQGNLQIVANLTNVYEIGDHVGVALIGTTIKDGGDSFDIKERKVRGELSQGMALGKFDGTELDAEVNQLV